MYKFRVGYFDLSFWLKNTINSKFILTNNFVGVFKQERLYKPNA